VPVLHNTLRINRDASSLLKIVCSHVLYGSACPALRGAEALFMWC
jgi:hypothetical protein